MKIALAQIAPVLLDRERTLAKVVDAIVEAGRAGARLVTFGETLVPGYPIWLERTGGARFDDDLQKTYFARYLDQSVTVASEQLDGVRAAARDHGIAVVLGVAERGTDRGGHTIYCSRLFVGPNGDVLSVHRKLVPTHDERLVWGMGDAAGLVTHPVEDFVVGALNCWENWMPLARAALQAQGETLRVAIWPGSERNTRDITRFMALEGRSYVASVGSLLRPLDVPADVPARDQLLASGEHFFTDGGSCVAGPDGRWIVEPVVGDETVLYAEIEAEQVRRERQNFDPSGHYSRPELLHLVVDRRRYTTCADADRE
jgi:nitrilase